MMRSTPEGDVTSSAPVSSIPAVTPCFPSQSTRVPVALGDAARQACRISPGLCPPRPPAAPTSRQVLSSSNRPRSIARPELTFDRGRARANLGRIGGRLQVHADADHDGLVVGADAMALGENAGELPAPDQQIVGPLEIGRESRGRDNAVTHADAGGERQSATAFDTRWVAQ